MSKEEFDLIHKYEDLVDRFDKSTSTFWYNISVLRNLAKGFKERLDNDLEVIIKEAVSRNKGGHND